MKRLLAALALAAMPAAAQAAGPLAGPTTCPAERAVYELNTEDGDYGVSLVPARSIASMASDLYLRLTTPQRDYWFVFSVSQGYSGITLLPVSDPYAEEAADSGPRDLLGEPYGANRDAEVDAWVLSALRFYALDADLTFLHEPPMRGEEAPPYLMMPEIGLALWYEPRSLTEDPGADRDPMPRGVFRHTGCLVAPPPAAYP